jgi:hypothetical protein
MCRACEAQGVKLIVHECELLEFTVIKAPWASAGFGSPGGSDLIGMAEEFCGMDCNVQDAKWCHREWATQVEYVEPVVTIPASCCGACYHHIAQLPAAGWACAGNQD